MIYYLFLVAALAATAGAQLLLKYSGISRHRRVCYWLSVALFIMATFCSYAALKKIRLDTLYVAASLNMVLVVLASTLLFRERVSLRNALALLCIVGGVSIFAMV